MGWLESTGHERGAVADAQTLFELGADWYRTRLDVNWQPASASEATTMFAAHGLTGEFWSLL